METREMNVGKETAKFVQCFLALSTLADVITDTMADSGYFSDARIDEECSKFYDKIDDAKNIILDWAKISMYSSLSDMNNLNRDVIDV